MDGLMINTEDIYTMCINKILAEFNKGPLTWDVKIQLQGLPGPRATQKVIDAYELPLTISELEERNIKVQSAMWPQCRFMPGALELIQYLKASSIPIALCTSSSSYKYTQKTAHLRSGFDLFDVVVTGDDAQLRAGKPAPDIWHLGLQRLNDKRTTTDPILPIDCLVFEDGLPGVHSGLAFGGQVIWVPHKEAYPYLGNPEMTLNNQGELLESLDAFVKSKYHL